MPGTIVTPAVPLGQFVLQPGANPYALSTLGNSGANNCIVTVAAQAGLTNYMTGFVATSGPAANANTGQGAILTISGLIGANNMQFQFAESLNLGGELVVNFPMPIPASGSNVAIVANLSANGANCGNCALSVYGYYQ